MNQLFKFVLIGTMALFCMSCAPGFKMLGEDDDRNAEPYRQYGDMILYESQIDDTVQVTGAADFKKYKSDPWSRGIVPIRFRFAVSQERRNQFFAACAEWSKSANVRCVPYSGQENRIEVRNVEKEGCTSEVGRGPGRFGDATDMNLANGCWTMGVLVHELGHALGLIHEHQRPDRDLYVKFDKNNTQKDFVYAFDRLGGARTLGPYDYRSVMHYGYNYFAKDNAKPNLEPLPGRGYIIDDLGAAQLTGIPTELDGKAMAAIYGAPTMAGQPPQPPPTQAPVAPTPPPGYRNQVASLGTIMPDERLYSDDGRSVFIYQLDGNLVLYRDQEPVWASDTFATPGRVTMQGDGNLVMQNSMGMTVWSSDTANNDGASLHVQGDGNVVIYTPAGQPVWATGTND